MVELQEEPGLYDATRDMLFQRTRAPARTLIRPRRISSGIIPGLGDLAASLAGSGAHSELRRMAAKFPTCAVAALDFRIPSWDDIERESGLLTLFLTPAELEAGTD